MPFFYFGLQALDISFLENPTRRRTSSDETRRILVSQVSTPHLIYVKRPRILLILITGFQIASFCPKPSSTVLCWFQKTACLALCS